MSGGESYHLDAINNVSQGVRVLFEREGDHFRHTIHVVDGSEAIAIAVSIHELSDEGWPVSPPVQEIRELPDSVGKQLTLTGAASQAHWSATVRVVRPEVFNASERLDVLCIEFDFAARVRAAPRPLSFSYHTLGEASWVDMPFSSIPEMSSDVAMLNREPYMAFISPKLNSGLDLPLILRRFRISSPHEKSRFRRFEPIMEAPREIPATMRWQYWIAADNGNSTSSPRS
jgi:hypothetical protein